MKKVMKWICGILALMVLSSGIAYISKPNLSDVDKEFHTNLAASRIQPCHMIWTFVTLPVYEMCSGYIETNYYADTARISKQNQWLMKPGKLKQWTEKFVEEFEVCDHPVTVTVYDPHEQISVSSTHLSEGEYEPYMFVSTSDASGYYTIVLARRSTNFYQLDSTQLNETDRNGIAWILETYYFTGSNS